jgi:predicted Holliday junction resolvase-like endonuclease
VEVFLLGCVVALVLVVVVMSFRIRAIAAGQFERWREQELGRARDEAARLADDEARLQVERWQQEREAGIRADAIQRSKGVILGRATEHLAPVMGIFPYSPKDVRFVGSPVDLVVFDGLDEGELRAIVLVEVKTGSSQLSTRQRQVRAAVERGEIKWVEWRLPPAL